MFKNSNTLLFIAVGLLTSISSVTASDTWTGFRGTGSNISTARNLPLKWSPDQGIRWKQTVPGYGQSSPVIWKNKVFVTSIEGPQQETCLLHAYDLASGKLIWSKQFKASQTKKSTAMVSRAAPTPAVDGQGIYAFYESGDVFGCRHDGSLLWHRSLVKDYGDFVSNHGIGNSVAQTPDQLIVLTAHDGPSYLLSLDKKTGKTNWKTDRESGVAWTSPVIADRNGTPEIIVSARGTVKGYQGLTGKLLWTLSGISGNTIPSASVFEDYILIGASTDRRNPDGANASDSNCCLKLVTRDGKPGYEVLWKAEKAVSYYCTPLAYQGCAYFVNKVGVVFCLELKTGKQHYAQRLSGPCWSSPLAAGDQIYFFTKKGITDVIAPGPEFKRIAANSLLVDTSNTDKSEDSKGHSGKPKQGYSVAGPIAVYGAAAVDQALLIRTGTELYCIGTPEN
ncbi:outer membrane biogenesis protein BamB [Gimesia panareensis]|uniref:Outer membrane biogenesis protein BamB n=1 Tax=Gimesia panareensis TaxID=2527978 RepID=A0A518FJK3_9PLAN|nr:PQQ-binding-like beta-propeller repeat protein [Gimesia panareensis]QDV16522.1 outer membrane biogenesis protein BamB [Gimesia panareensis]